MDRETIITYVKEVTRIKTTRVTTLCQYLIDEVYKNHIAQNVYQHKFSWLKGYGYLSTGATYSTGTASVTQDSTSVTGTDTVWVDTTHEHWWIKFGTDTDWYEISDINNGTQVMTLATAYIGTTDTDATYTMYKVWYDLASDFGKMNWIKQVTSPSRIIPKAELEYQTLMPDDFDETTGEIRAYMMAGLNPTTGYPRLKFIPIQTSRKMTYYCYDKRLATINSTGGTPIFSSDWHMLFVHKLASLIYDAHDMLQKAATEEAKFKEMLKSFVDEDISLSGDKANVMADEAIFKDKESVYSRLPSNYAPEV